MASGYQGKRSGGGRSSSGKNRGKLILLIVLLAVVIALAAALLWLKSGAATQQQSEQEAQAASDEADPQQETAAEETEDAESAGIVLPYTTEEGLTVRSLFSSDLMNPDGGGELVEGLASVELINDTAEYLSEAALTVTLSDGTAYAFSVSDIPAGGSVIAFSTENAVYDGSGDCEAITSTAAFASGDPLLSEQVSCSVEGTTVTLINLTDQELSAVQVTCHDTLDSAAYGGRSYTYTLDSIPAGASAELEAEDCVMGEVQVVRITAGE